MISISISFIVLLVLGTPIAFCIGISALAGLMRLHNEHGSLPLDVVTVPIEVRPVGVGIRPQFGDLVLLVAVAVVGAE